MKFLKHNSGVPTERVSYIETETTRMIQHYNKFWFMCCCPDFWVNKVDLPDAVIKVYRPIIIAIHAAMVVFCLSCTLSLWTHDNLSPTQRADRFSYGLASPIITMFYHFVILYYAKDIKHLLYTLVVALKVDHNDKAAEQNMLKQSRLQNGIFFSCWFCNMLFIALYSTIEAITTDPTFIMCISPWPAIEDKCAAAESTRIVMYFLWFGHVVRTMAVFLIIHTVVLCVGQQYKNLHSYFESLAHIFDERELSQEEKEIRYKMKLKTGIRQHAITLWCVDECQRIFMVTLSAHVLLWCGLLVSILPSVLNDERRTLGLLVSNAPKVAAAFIGLGYYMWPAGDITVEASKLSDAMYGSGWQCCYYDASPVRKMIVMAMMQAQRPIELKAFGHFILSYETYVAIVKLSYSVFSVLY